MRMEELGRVPEQGEAKEKNFGGPSRDCVQRKKKLGQGARRGKAESEKS